jgi:hypothetical protein
LTFFPKQTLMDMTSPRNQNKPFELGELVRIIEGTHDPAMPDHRTGLIVEVVAGPGGDEEVYLVQFGTHTLKFHPCWMEKIL